MRWRMMAAKSRKTGVDNLDLNRYVLVRKPVKQPEQRTERAKNPTNSAGVGLSQTED